MMRQTPTSLAFCAWLMVVEVGCVAAAQPNALDGAASARLREAIHRSPQLAKLVRSAEACPQMRPVLYWVDAGRYVDARNEISWVDRLSPAHCDAAVGEAEIFLDTAALIEVLSRNGTIPEENLALRGIKLPALRSVALQAISSGGFQLWLRELEAACSTKHGVTQNCLDVVHSFEEGASHTVFAGRGRQLLRLERENDKLILALLPEMTQIAEEHARHCSYQRCDPMDYGDTCFDYPGTINRDSEAWKFDAAWASLVGRLPPGSRRLALEESWSDAVDYCALVLPVPEGR